MSSEISIFTKLSCGIFKMTMVEAYICGKKIDPPSSTSELPSMIVSLLIESVAQNTTGSVFLAEGGSDVEISGSLTEKAILQWGVKVSCLFICFRSFLFLIFDVR